MDTVAVRWDAIPIPLITSITILGKNLLSAHSRDTTALPFAQSAIEHLGFIFEFRDDYMTEYKLKLQRAYGLTP